MVKIAINGFGRIGRAVFKICLQKGIEIAAVNDLTDTKTLANLLKHDSNYGEYDASVSFDDSHLLVNGKAYRVFSEPDPSKLPWGELSVDIVLECTGRFRDLKTASTHLKAGAKRVILSAPGKGEGISDFVISVNEPSSSDLVLSNASCTTNCIAPVIQVLNDSFGIRKAFMTTVHAYTGDQNLLDGPHKDLRRARNAATNIVPTSTGAAKTTTNVIPSLQGKFDGLAIRVPVPVVSLSDITALLSRKVTVDEVNSAFSKAVGNELYKNVLGVTNQELVSSDFIKNSHSCIVDLPLTKVVDGDLIKVIAWYDNEWGYSCRLVEQAIEVSKKL
ncbi:MAG: type I glyceraldehyde-3-phosphate dehydrogenase [Candidatus Micrarchaeota archaeon]